MRGKDPLVAAWVLGATVALLAAAEPEGTERTLAPGDALPALGGKTLAGPPLTLPLPSGRAALLVLGFSRDAAQAMVPWLQACRSRPDSGDPAVDCYDVRMVQGIPRLLRGFVEKGMRKESPAELLASTLLVYRDNDLWKRRLGVRDPDTAHVVLLSSDGRVAALLEGPFSEERLEEALARLGRVMENAWSPSRRERVFLPKSPRPGRGLRHGYSTAGQGRKGTRIDDGF